MGISINISKYKKNQRLEIDKLAIFNSLNMMSSLDRDCRTHKIGF